jgi:hypothetical protein
MSAKNFSGLGQRPALVEFHIEDDPEYRDVSACEQESPGVRHDRRTKVLPAQVAVEARSVAWFG